MDRFFKAVLNHRKLVLAIFIIATVASILCIPQVKVNYNFADYLPADNPSTIALHDMQGAFGTSAPNSQLFAGGIDQVQAEQLADALQTIPEVESLLWLGSVVDLRMPLAAADPDLVAAWCCDEGYLYQITLDTSDSGGALRAMNDVRALAGEYTDDIAMAGEAINTATATGSSNTEIQLIMIMAIIVILGLLMLTSQSWFEPVLFIIVVLIAIALNLGTNIFRGEISFVTQMCAAILQLAVSMDYGIVMLHNYREFSAQGLEPEDAMVKSMHRGFSVIASSAATTFFGFLALCVMVFLLGADMGIVLAKGIIFSFVCVMFMLPCLILICRKPLEKTRHRNFLPSFEKFARVCMKVSLPFAIIVVLITVPAFLGQRHLNYVYGASGFVEQGSQLYTETERIDNLFGANESWVVMVPEGNWAEETALVRDLEALPLISGVTSYTTVASEAIPTQMVDSSQIEQLISGGYSRLVLSTKVKGEGDIPFGLVEQVRDVCARHFGDSYRMVGAAVTCYDINTTVTSDSLRVILASILAIGLVLVIMFRSATIPIALLLSIEISIWINLAIPYFMGTSIQYIGYLVISSIMLGATVDYTIILTRGYLEERKTLPPREACIKGISRNAITILTSGTILTVCGALIGAISSNGVIAELGTLVGRGAAIAAVLTFLFLPALLVYGDWIIQHTTYGLKHFKPGFEGAIAEGDGTDVAVARAVLQVTSGGLKPACGTEAADGNLRDNNAAAMADITRKDKQTGADTLEVSHEDTR